MCPNCNTLSASAAFPHAHLQWRLEKYDPTATEALGAKVFEVCTACGVRWFDQRSRFLPEAR